MTNLIDDIQTYVKKSIFAFGPIYSDNLGKIESAILDKETTDLAKAILFSLPSLKAMKIIHGDDYDLLKAEIKGLFRN